MPVPKVKVSRSRRNKRSASKNIEMHPTTECQTCRATLASHVVCQGCGYYKGVKILRTRTERMSIRGKARAEQTAALHAAQAARAQQASSEVAE